MFMAHIRAVMVLTENMSKNSNEMCIIRIE